MKIFIYYNSCMYVSSASMNIVVLVGSLIVMWFDISSFSKEKYNALYTMSVYIYLSLAWTSNPARKFSHSNLAKVLPVKGGIQYL